MNFDAKVGEGVSEQICATIKGVKHLLVDLDGTLLGASNFSLSVSFVVKMLRRLRSELGVIAAFKAMSLAKKMVETPDERYSCEARIVRAFVETTGLAEQDVREMLYSGIRSVFPSLEKYFFPIKNAKEFLDWAENYYPITLATNPVWPQDIIGLRVKWAKIEPSTFQLITDATMMHACKPHLEYYRELLNILQIKPEQAILIGNDFANDLIATRLNIPVFLITEDQRIQKLSMKGGKAPAWKGTFSSLWQEFEKVKKDSN